MEEKELPNIKDNRNLSQFYFKYAEKRNKQEILES